MQYLVRALDASQQIQVLALEALTEADAAAQARARQLTPLSVDRQRSVRRRAHAFGLLLFAQELLALVGAGLSVVEALETLIEKETHGHRAAVLKRLVRDLRDGHRLSAALAAQPDVFPPLFAGLVEAAEGTSDLPHALSRYIDYETRLATVRHRMVSAAVYPLILLGVGAAVSLFLLAYVVPKFAAVYQGTGRDLPWASRMLMEWGVFAGQHGTTLAISAFVVVAALWWAARTQLRGGEWWHLLRAVPGARQRIAVMELSRLYLTLGMLLEGGIPVNKALTLSSAVTTAASRDALQSVRDAVQSGEPLSAALESSGLSTPVAQRLLRVGERSGQLGTMLVRTASFYDEETGRWMDRFAKTFEPVLMTAIGLVVGLIVILLYMPVFELAGSLQ